MPKAIIEHANLTVTRPERSAELKDLLVDLAGIVMGLGLAILLAAPVSRAVRALARWTVGLLGSRA